MLDDHWISCSFFFLSFLARGNGRQWRNLQFHPPQKKKFFGTLEFHWNSLVFFKIGFPHDTTNTLKEGWVRSFFLLLLLFFFSLPTAETKVGQNCRVVKKNNKCCAHDLSEGMCVRSSREREREKKKKEKKRRSLICVALDGRSGSKNDWKNSKKQKKNEKKRKKNQTPNDGVATHHFSLHDVYLFAVFFLDLFCCCCCCCCCCCVDGWHWRPVHRSQFKKEKKTT